MATLGIALAVAFAVALAGAGFPWLRHAANGWVLRLKG
jgi:hypothetical protein